MSSTGGCVLCLNISVHAAMGGVFWERHYREALGAAKRTSGRWVIQFFVRSCDASHIP
jgi:uncharacterized iron-regulated membrane protein